MILLISCLCLLILQMGGLHQHVDADGEHAGLHGTHHHQAEHHGHDHSADRDVPVLEKMGLTWSKLMPLILACVAVVLAEYWFRQQSWPLPFTAARPRRRSRWRPPLRAPPVTF